MHVSEKNKFLNLGKTDMKLGVNVSILIGNGAEMAEKFADLCKFFCFTFLQ